MIERVLRESVNAQATRLSFFLRLLHRMFGQVVQVDGSVSLTLLLAAILRVEQSGQAAQLLAEAGYVEEIQAITRTLVELTVNAVYLQYSGESELERYIEFHPESLSKQVGMLAQRRSHGFASTLMRRLENLTSRRRAKSSNGDADPAWTRRSLLDRAELADTVSGIPILSPLVRRCYPKGHAAIHGTIGSLNSFIDALATGQSLQREDRLAPLSEALFTINLCLLTLCLYLNTSFRLGMDEAIDEAANADSTAKPGLQGAL